MQCVFLLCALPAPSMVHSPSDEKASLAPVPSTTNVRGSPACFSWGDVDGDGRLDLAAVEEDGTLRLLLNAGNDRFEDVTDQTGLASVRDVALALWADYDGDGWLDLFVGGRQGASRLFRNEKGTLTDMTAASGLASEGAVHSAAWLDDDGDGRLDLFVVTQEKSRLFRGLDGGFFQEIELLAMSGDAGRMAGGSSPAESLSRPTSDSVSDGDGRLAGSPSGNAARPSGGSAPPGSPPYPDGVHTVIGFPGGCASSIRDDAAPGACLAASSTPTIGMLYPISASLFVATSGDVGIGTTNPGAQLHVAGTARISDALTLVPSTDLALNVNTGSIYKNGVLFLHTKGGRDNTAIGKTALANVTTGKRNTACGFQALRSDTTGSRNTAVGYSALESNTTGFANTACGFKALLDNSTGYGNTAIGNSALVANLLGNENTASGFRALESNRTGSGNTAAGSGALSSNTQGSNNSATGSASLGSNTIGNNNTAVGASSLGGNTTGNYNTACGALALSSNGAGSHNTASGWRALDANTTGVHNLAIGSEALSSNTTGNLNTAVGRGALRSSTVTNGNTALGARVLYVNTTGAMNTACGATALSYNTTGARNAASGYQALLKNTTGSNNTANGFQSLAYNTSGTDNTACGHRTLFTNVAGSRNIALGHGAGALTTGSDNIAIGNAGATAESSTVRIGTAGSHTRAFVAGIRGTTTGIANAVPVLVDGAGQLGTVSSSRRFKEEIRDMGELSARLLELRPVAFRYKPEIQSGERPLEYGLIAEEVAEIFPDLVVYDEAGLPFTVKYHILSSMLLNELKNLRARTAAREDDLERQVDDLRAKFAAFEERITATSVRATIR